MAVSLAAWLGRFIGSVLAELAPVLLELYREFKKPTSEDGAAPDDLRNRLRDRINRLPDGRDSDDLHSAGRSGSVEGDSKKG